MDSFFDPEDTVEGEVSRAFPESFNPDAEEERALAAQMFDLSLEMADFGGERQLDPNTTSYLRSRLSKT